VYPRTNYEMTKEDEAKLLSACEPTPAWKDLGKKMGFDYMTVQPIKGKSMEFFTAIPSETESQKADREGREKEEAKAAGLEKIEKEIQQLLKRLARLMEM